MSQIWEFPFEIENFVEIQMPRGAKILTVQMQNGTPCIWAEVDPAERKETRRFRVFGTGEDFAPPTYIATFQNGPFVWHIYEE